MIALLITLWLLTGVITFLWCITFDAAVPRIRNIWVRRVVLLVTIPGALLALIVGLLISWLAGEETWEELAGDFSGLLGGVAEAWNER